MLLVLPVGSYTQNRIYSFGAAVLLSGLVLALVFRLFSRTVPGKRREPLPPGPQGWPILGSLLQNPQRRYWLKYDEWTRRYGDVVRITSFGETTIILGSAQAASDLLDGRGPIYSDRPTSTFAGEMVGWNLSIGSAHFSPTSTIGPVPLPTNPWPIHSDARFRALRKILHEWIGPRACTEPGFVELQARACCGLLLRLLGAGKEGNGEEQGADFEKPIRQSTAAFILLLTYGYEVNHEGYDPLVEIVDDATISFSVASEPGRFWVDRWPILKHVPAWFPGGKFHKQARLFKEARERLYDVPFGFVEQQLRSGTALPSLVSRQIETSDSVEDDRTYNELVKVAAAALYQAGAATSQIAFRNFLLAMTLHPDVQQRAQGEIDALLGPPSSFAGCRWPSMDDYEKLPYVRALVKELWRWGPPVPIGLAHRVTEDNVYRGMFIEKGATVYTNIWGILHDEKTYPSPFRFHPARFLDANGNLKTLAKTEDPGFVAFGFGRRSCPGFRLAENSVFLYVAFVLYVFDICKAKDASGRDIVPELEHDGFLCTPKPFKCRLTPRSLEAKDFILRETRKHEVMDG